MKIKITLILSAFILSACGSAKEQSPQVNIPSVDPGIKTNPNVSTATTAANTPTPTSISNSTPPPIPRSTPGLTSEGFISCENATDPSHLCLGVKLVSYQNSNGIPVLTHLQAEQMMIGVNSAWASCNLSYQIESFEQTDPTQSNLDYSPDWENDAGKIRQHFADRTRFLVVAVGPWADATIAVTQMPGTGPFGTLVDSRYAQNPLTVGHELGHYQGLEHLSDPDNLMNPYIGRHTVSLSQSQCEVARNTDLSDWKAMIRY